jgi:hypothetical protein
MSVVVVVVTQRVHEPMVVELLPPTRHRAVGVDRVYRMYACDKPTSFAYGAGDDTCVESHSFPDLAAAKAWAERDNAARVAR